LLKRLFSPQQRKPLRNGLHSFRPHIEELERRDVPSITVMTPPSLTNFDGDNTALTFMVMDTAGNPMTYSFANLPPGITPGSQSGFGDFGSVGVAGTIASTADQQGPYSVTLTATDTVTGDVGSGSLLWNVNPVTVSLANPGPQANFDGDQVALQLSASDSAPFHLLTYTLSSSTPLPAGLNLNSATGEIYGTIASNADQAGPYAVTITATDAAANVSATQTFDWNVYANPVASNVTLSVGHDVSIASIDLNQDVSGGDGNPLQISIVSGPTYGQLTENEDGTDAYTPPAQWTGTDSFTIKATDGTKDSNIATITIDVTNSTLVWDGLGSDNLGSDPMNWVGDVAPISGDTVVFNGNFSKNATLDANFPASLSEMDVNAGYTGQITLERDLTVNTLLSQSGGTIVMGDNNLNIASAATYNMSAGNLDGPGYLNIAGTVNWTGGSWDPADAEITGALNISPSSSVSLTGWAVNVDSGGQLNWTQGNVENADSVVNVATGGAFKISSSGTWADALGDGGSTINNAGLLCSTGGTCGSPVSIDAALNSSSDLEVEAGMVSLQAGGGLSGLLDIQSHAALILRNGLFVAEALSQTVNQGQGILIVDGATSQALNLVIGTASSLGFPSVSLQNLYLRAGGEISGAGGLLIRGTFTWAGGELSGGGALSIDGRMNVTFTEAPARDDEPVCDLSLGRALVNNGTVTLAGLPTVAGTPVRAVLSISRSGSFVNDGQLIFQGAATEGRVTLATSAFGGTVVNNGQLIVRGGGTAGLFTVTVPGAAPREYVVNGPGGSISVESGTLTIDGYLMNYGYLTASAGATVRFGGGTFTFDPDANDTGGDMMQGAGSYVAGSFAVIVLPANSGLGASNFYLESGGTLQGPGSFAAQQFVWSGGTITDCTTTIARGSQMSISGNVALDNSILEDSGTITWGYTELPYAIAMLNSSQIQVNGGSFVTYNVAGSITTDTDQNPNSSNQIVVSNGGTFTRNTTEVSGTITIGAAFQNTGGRVTLQGNTTFASFYQSGARSVSVFGIGTYQLSAPEVDARVFNGGTVQIQGGFINSLVGLINTTFVGYGEVDMLLASQSTITLTGNLSSDIGCSFFGQTNTNLGGFQLSAGFIVNHAGCTINEQGGSLTGRVINRGTINN
jgi:hypothetical protein